MTSEEIIENKDHGTLISPDASCRVLIDSFLFPVL